MTLTLVTCIFVVCVGGIPLFLLVLVSVITRNIEVVNLYEIADIARMMYWALLQDTSGKLVHQKGSP